MSEDNSKKVIESQEVAFQRLSEIISTSSNTLINFDDLNTPQIVENSTCDDSFPKGESLKMFTPVTNTAISKIDYSTRKNPKDKKRLKKTKSSVKGKTVKRKKNNSTTFKNRSFSASRVGSKVVEAKTYSGTEPSSPDSISLLKECYEEDVMANDNFSKSLETNVRINSNSKKVDKNYEVKKPTSNGTNPVNSYLKDRSFVTSGDDYGSTENIDGDDHLFASSTVERVNKSCQTDSCELFESSLISTGEETITYHVRFIESVIKLKYMISSKKWVSKDELSKVIDKRFESNVSLTAQEENIPHDTVNYLLRLARVDSVFQETVSSLLNHLEMTLDENLEDLAIFWRGSIYELAVKVLNEAVSCELKLRTLTDSFINKIINSILNSEEGFKSLAQETKAAFIIKFCDCSYHSHSAIEHIINKIKILNSAKYGGQTSLEDKHDWSRLAKNSYFLLRTLVKLLTMFGNQSKKDNSKDFGIPKESKIQNFNILEMWKKNWRQADVVTKEVDRPTHRTDYSQNCKSQTSKWCEDLNEILVHCIVHLPVLVNPIEKCVRLAGKILMENHSDILSF